MGLLYGAYERSKALELLARDGEQSGRDLRVKINNDLCSVTPMRQRLTRLKLGWLLTMDRTSFYAMMHHLERTNEVEGWDKDEDIAGYTLQLRWYRIRGSGQEPGSMTR